ncbi:CPBP family intramembrane glutamic endopeptidase [Lentilactobacillus sp. SPB1-3]|uniref:CPBP family intramembrane glutamic endopeptidase n=1 Tax=Lentilactobacillus terminaliae TaxID=3003483 RepID=A0ACD5DFD1_9LACO|nr:type II CAAX endopeptidase family protein [Lentilactobacillus sp. SPB1-3]MCZ0976642.1 type II CAAX endopeptidase family protein [Lentilactobacillus sp. SPB1-3]
MVNTANYLSTKILQILKWIGFVAIYLISSSIFQSTTFFLNDPVKAQYALGIGLIATAIALSIIGWRYYRQLSNFNPRNFGHKPATTKKLWLLLALFIGMMSFQYIWSWLITSGIIHMPENQTAVVEQSIKMPIWNDIYSVFLAPIFEEIIFRGIFMNYFFNKDNRLNNILAMVTSALIFGFAHEMQFDLNWLMYSGLGLFLSYSYMHYRDIRFNIALHMINNLVSSV